MITTKSVHVGQIVEGVSLDLESIKQHFLIINFIYLYICHVSTPLFNNCFKHFFMTRVKCTRVLVVVFTWSRGQGVCCGVYLE